MRRQPTADIRSILIMAEAIGRSRALTPAEPTQRYADKHGRRS